jgi:hypothetical protein
MEEIKEVVIMQHKLKKLDMLPSGKPVSFAEFKRRSDVHIYGRSGGKRIIVFIGIPRENLFGFYTLSNTKLESLKDAYHMYKDICFLEDYYINTGNIQWGNCGMPISYNNLRRSGDILTLEEKRNILIETIIKDDTKSLKQ